MALKYYKICAGRRPTIIGTRVYGSIGLKQVGERVIFDEVVEAKNWFIAENP